MFRNKSAWFSSTVPTARQTVWTLEGGTIADWRKADYLFSEDATCPDTLRIFESKDYVLDEVVVFHSLFLSVCEKRQSVKSVSIGHYVLPPTSVQDAVRKVVRRMIWEEEAEKSVEQSYRKSVSSSSDDKHSEFSKSSTVQSDNDSSESDAPRCNCNLGWNKLTGYITMDSLQKYSEDLCDFHGCVRCFNCKAHCCQQHT